MSLGEQCDHLFDLHDLLCRTAEKSEQRVAERLAENTQAGKSRDALSEVRIAAPRERVDKRRPVFVEPKIVGQGGGDMLSAIVRCAPFEGVGVEAKLSERVAPEPGP